MITHAIIDYKYWLTNAKNPDIIHASIKIDGNSEKSIVKEFWLRFKSNYYTNEIENIQTYPTL